MSLTEVTMPKMGESITEGTVIVWHKKPGDVVKEDETLLEIGTDKVDTDIPSPAAGILEEILVEEGATVDVGTKLAVIETGAKASKGSAAPPPTSAAPVQGAPPVESVPRQGPRAREEDAPGEVPRMAAGGRFFSPLVRSIAREEGLSLADLESIRGSGRDGRVTKKDVLEYVKGRSEESVPPAPAPIVAPPSLGEASLPAEAPSLGEGYEADDGIIRMNRMRQIIAEHMVRSKAISAHVTSFAEADATNLVAFRERYKESFRRREGVKLTYTPFFVRAAVEALRDHPILNASVEDDSIILKRELHVGIAVAIGKTGLVVPVIRDAGGKSITGLARAAADLAERARRKELQPEELQGGTFTITNVGSLGTLMGTPIINQPQVAILAVGTIKKRPVVVEDPRYGDLIAVRHMVYLSLSYDHRIIDGAMAASFLRRFVRSVESMGPSPEW